MKSKFIYKAGNNGLVILFGGWGSDSALFKLIPPKGYDFLLCYDYATLDFDTSVLEGYDKIRLLAWSMGVWAAERVFGSGELIEAERFQMKIALNGTPLAKDDKYGIPTAIFEGTLNNLSEASLQKFRKRMCLTPQELEYYTKNLPKRSLEDLHNELQAINEQLSTGILAGWESSSNFWDLAIVGSRDLIFPTQNQIEYWQAHHTKVTIMAGSAHYNSSLFDELIQTNALWKKS